MHDNTEISLPLYFVLSVPLLFPIDKTETASQEKGGVKSKLTSHILILRDMKLMKEMQRPFLWIAKKPGALLKLVLCTFQYLGLLGPLSNVEMFEE